MSTSTQFSSLLFCFAYFFFPFARRNWLVEWCVLLLLLWICKTEKDGHLLLRRNNSMPWFIIGLEGCFLYAKLVLSHAMLLFPFWTVPLTTLWNIAWVTTVVILIHLSPTTGKLWDCFLSYLKIWQMTHKNQILK